MKFLPICALAVLMASCSSAPDDDARVEPSAAATASASTPQVEDREGEDGEPEEIELEDIKAEETEPEDIEAEDIEAEDLILDYSDVPTSWAVRDVDVMPPGPAKVQPKQCRKLIDDFDEIGRQFASVRQFSNLGTTKVMFYEVQVFRDGRPGQPDSVMDRLISKVPGCPEVTVSSPREDTVLDLKLVDLGVDAPGARTLEIRSIQGQIRYHTTVPFGPWSITYVAVTTSEPELWRDDFGKFVEDGVIKAEDVLAATPG